MIRIILFLLSLYAFIYVFYSDVVIRFNDPTPVLLGHFCGTAIVLSFAITMFLNALSEFKSGMVKYRTYFATLVSCVVFGYFSIEEFLGQKDIAVIIFAILLMFLLGCLTIYDFLYFKKMNKTIEVEVLSKT